MPALESMEQAFLHTGLESLATHPYQVYTHAHTAKERLTPSVLVVMWWCVPGDSIAAGSPTSYFLSNLRTHHMFRKTLADMRQSN